MLIQNVKIFTAEQIFCEGKIRIENDRITEVVPVGQEEAVNSSLGMRENIMDGKGSYVIPGMIDMHFHGCMGYDICDGTIEALERIAAYQASIGVTAIAPATLTLPVPELESVLCNAAQFCRMQREKGAHGQADLVGINMEGPFISPQKKGAQDERYIIPCSIQLFEEFYKASDGLVKVVGIAPEEMEVADFIHHVKKMAVVSLAHTDAGYHDAMDAFAAGASHVVHLYDGMRGFSHREPGTVGAVFDSNDVTAEIICDGVHVSPAAVRLALKALGSGRLIFISDSMRAAGLQDGVYMLGGLKVKVSGRRAVLTDGGNLAGSVSSLPECMRIAVKEMGIPLETAVACVTVNPAKRLGIYGEYGCISAGRKADLVFLDSNLRVQKVIKDGVEI